MKRYFLPFIIFICSLSVYAQTHVQPTQLIQKYSSATVFEKSPYLLYTGKNTEILLMWQLLNTATCTLEWGTDATCNSGSKITTEFGIAHQHKFLLSNILADTKYFYKITANGESKTGSFRTGVSDTESAVTFYSYGDTRTYPATHNTLAQTMLVDINKNPRNQSIVLMNGDFVQYGNTEDSWTNEYFDPQYLYLQELLANMPYLTTMGNHEGQGILFAKYFPYPQFVSGRYYYSFDYGPVHFTMIDQYTDYKPGSEQYAWLENDLKNSNKAWKIIMDHEPAWTAQPISGGHGNNKDAQNYIQPLCLKYGVSFIFSGHNHFYSRANVNNVMHITTGGGGAPLYPPGAGRENIVTIDQSNHFCKVEITDNKLKMTAIRSNGTIIESFDYVKSNEPGIMISPATITLNPGDTKSLIATVWPTQSAGEVISWSTDNPNIATISQTGELKAIALGTATITASILNGIKKATVSVLVSPAEVSSVLDNCDVITDWKSSKTLTISIIDKKEGSGALEFVGNTTDEFKKAFTTPFNSQANTTNGMLRFWYFVSDPTKCGTVRVELGSGGVADVNELSWGVTNLQVGWNLISLKISNATSSGTANLNAINWFRIYDTKTASITTRLDDLQVGPENVLSALKTHPTTSKNKKEAIFVLDSLNKHKLIVNLYGFENSINLYINIFQLNGVHVFRQRLTDFQKAEIDLPHSLKNPMYFVSIESGTSSVVKKLILK